MTKNNDDCRELLPCPFCGGVPIIEHIFYPWFIRCQTCNSQTADLRTKEEAIKAWNTRAPVENSSENRQMDSNVSKQSTQSKEGELLELLKKTKASIEANQLKDLGDNCEWYGYADTTLEYLDPLIKLTEAAQSKEGVE